MKNDYAIQDIKIIQKKHSDKHNDSIWYDGDIAEGVGDKGTKMKLIAAGEIQIRDGEGYVVYDGSKMRNNGITGGLENDDDLNKIDSEGEEGYYWEHNNWFEILYMTEDGEWDGEIGETFGSYDEAIDIFKEELKEDEK